MRLLRNAGNQNNVVGIFLLILLAVIAGPSTLPRIFPPAENGIPCDRLPRGTERANHQSLIGRAASDPISLAVKSDPLPANNEPLYITVTVINNSIGSVPILYNPNQILVGDNGSSGLGIIFEPTINLTNGAIRNNQGTASFPEEDIRILGPRQRCFHVLEFTVDPISQPTLYQGTVTVKAYYRINTPGQVVQTTPGIPLIFVDQGLRVRNGYLESTPAPIPIPSQTTP